MRDGKMVDIRPDKAHQLGMICAWMSNQPNLAPVPRVRVTG
ncbi:hypothetical protein MNBD_GAMMA14-277 [hydrothermal vent metagenome]|uniref:Uncharacterized protein n=1 Tax=hydrothermal vent metagenome TaxID=652676 RepID=A0A3B0ZCC5_9ZZZZ